MPETMSLPNPNRSRHISVLALAACILAALACYGCHASQKRPPAEAGKPLSLAAETLDPPPPLPADDRKMLQTGLKQIAEMRELARYRGPAPMHLEIAKQAADVPDILAAFFELRAATAKNAEMPVAVFDAKGSFAAQAGLYPEAQSIYQEIITRAPNEAAGYVGLSRVQFVLGQRTESLQTLERGAAAVPTEKVADRLSLAQEFEARAEMPRALEIAQEAMRQAPDQPHATLTVARLLGKLGRLPEARSLLEKLVDAQPDNAAALHGLADLLNNPLLPQRDPARAEQLLLRTVQRDPKDASAYANLGRLYEAQKRYKEAAIAYTRLLAITPDDASARLQLSYDYASLGEKRISAEQQKIAQRLLARDAEETRLINRREQHPTDPEARLALARHYAAYGQFGKALTEMQAAYCVSRGSERLRQELFAFYRRLGAPPPPLPKGTKP